MERQIRVRFAPKSYERIAFEAMRAKLSYFRGVVIEVLEKQWTEEAFGLKSLSQKNQRN